MLWLCILAYHSIDASDRLELNLSWTLINASTNARCEGSLPGNVFTDLQHAGVIPNPLAGNNVKSVQWVAHTDWIYRSQNFSFSQDVLDRKHIELVLDAVDTYAEVFLNGVLILECNNAFRTWKVEISHLLNTYENVLEIHLSSAYAKGKQQLTQQPHPLPGDSIRAVTRKPQFQYGWDWAPELNTMGVHRPLTIVAWDQIVVRDVVCETVSLSEESAKLLARAVFDLDAKCKFSYSAVFLNGTSAIEQTADTLSRSGGTYSVTWEIEVVNPELWWTHDLGNPHLYELVWKFSAATDKDATSIPVGIRTIHLKTPRDSVGSAFYFELNGHPTYMRGANWVPTHIFDSEAQNPANLLNACKDAHMNMLRVWGGGWYERNEFYRQCDSLGIMVWQDFMFACAMYPGDKAFLTNVREEAIDQLERLGKHPCIALWCGNNEVSEGWERWGWKSGLTHKEVRAVQKSYNRLFKKLLPKLVNEWDEVDYWESSPMLGRGDPNYVKMGDAHNWWVWHDGAPFENYQEQIPRFMSEFGFQSFPALTVWEGALREEQLDTNLQAFRAHQKHPRGFALINQYVQRNYPTPSNFEELTYLSQLNQSRGICMGIDAQRSADRYCMGSLFWQLNDCWPAISWSSIGFDGSLKALHYDLKHAYYPAHLLTLYKDSSFEVIITNDRLETLNGEMELHIHSLNGQEIGTKSVTNIELPSNDSYHIEIPTTAFNQAIDPASIYATLSWKDASNSHERIFTFGKPKDLNLKPQAIAQRITFHSNYFEVELLAEHFHKDVWLQTDIPGSWSENFIDLMPSEKHIIRFYPDNPDAFFQLNIISLNAFR